MVPWICAREAAVMCQVQPLAATATATVSSVFVKTPVRCRGRWQQQLHTVSSTRTPSSSLSALTSPRPPSAPSRRYVKAQYSHIDTTATLIGATGPLTLVCGTCTIGVGRCGARTYHPSASSLPPPSNLFHLGCACVRRTLLIHTNKYYCDFQ